MKSKKVIIIAALVLLAAVGLLYYEYYQLNMLDGMVESMDGRVDIFVQVLDDNIDAVIAEVNDVYGNGRILVDGAQQPLLAVYGLEKDFTGGKKYAVQAVNAEMVAMRMHNLHVGLSGGACDMAGFDYIYDGLPKSIAETTDTITEWLNYIDDYNQRRSSLLGSLAGGLAGLPRKHYDLEELGPVTTPSREDCRIENESVLVKGFVPTTAVLQTTHLWRTGGNATQLAASPLPNLLPK
ncbi:MAG: hypothetical protein GY803_32435 [Chloroflexi bacterium]|nr:hypothetical protein [Chloroflexota bacterium]